MNVNNEQFKAQKNSSISYALIIWENNESSIKYELCNSDV